MRDEGEGGGRWTVGLPADAARATDDDAAKDGGGPSIAARRDSTRARARTSTPAVRNACVKDPSVRTLCAFQDPDARAGLVEKEAIADHQQGDGGGAHLQGPVEGGFHNRIPEQGAGAGRDGPEPLGEGHIIQRRPFIFGEGEHAQEGARNGAFF